MVNKKSKMRKPLSGLFAEWRKVSAELCGEPLEGEKPQDAERRLRIEWTNEQLRQFYAKKGGRFTRINGRTVFIECDGALVSSWNSLREPEIRYLGRCMRELTGDGTAYRAGKVRQIARALWGPDAWEPFLIQRLADRYGVAIDSRRPEPESLTPRQAHELIEELLSRLARKEVAMAGDESTPEIDEHKLEEVRRRYRSRRIVES
jgi:hypothetical protein